MIYLSLFLRFFEIGAVSFGGGYGMISLIRETVLSNGWLSEDQFSDFFAVSESTPGPIAINMATFIGSSGGGVLGALLATLGVILPAFIIILIIASFSNGLLKNRGVEAFLSGVRPTVIALIIGTALTMGLKTLLGIGLGDFKFNADIKAIIIFVIITAVALFIKYVLKKKAAPVLLIIISAGLGILFYSPIF